MWNFIKKSIWKLKDPLLWFFLLISFGMWGLNRLSAEYIDEITIPVQIEGSRNIVDGSEIFDIECRVKGNGYAILIFKIFPNTRSIQLLSTDVVVSVDKKTGEYTLDRASVERSISTRLPNLDLLNVLNSNLKVDPITFTQKRVPVVSRLKVALKGQYMQIGATTVQPSEVTVRGESNYINEIDTIYTVSREITSPQELSGYLTLVQPKNIVLSTKNIRYNVSVDEYTEIKHNFVVKMASEDGKELSSSRFSMIPSSVTVVMNVSKNHYDEFNKSLSLFSPIVIYSKDKKLSDNYIGDNRYRVSMPELPIGVTLIDIEPQFISVFEK